MKNMINKITNNIFLILTILVLIGSTIYWAHANNDLRAEVVRAKENKVQQEYRQLEWEKEERLRNKEEIQRLYDYEAELEQKIRCRGKNLATWLELNCNTDYKNFVK